MIKDIELTIKTFWTEHSHNVWNSMIKKWSTHRVPHRKFPGRLHKEAAVFERPHGVRPCFTARINEATVDPTRHFVYLQPHVFRATFHDLFPNIWIIFGNRIPFYIWSYIWKFYVTQMFIFGIFYIWELYILYLKIIYFVKFYQFFNISKPRKSYILPKFYI